MYEVCRRECVRECLRCVCCVCVGCPHPVFDAHVADIGHEEHDDDRDLKEHLVTNKHVEVYEAVHGQPAGDPSLQADRESVE